MARGKKRASRLTQWANMMDRGYHRWEYFKGVPFRNVGELYGIGEERLKILLTGEVDEN